MQKGIVLDFMKKVITYGTFDMLHYGHINLLRRAKELGDYLVVVLSTDEFNWNMKQKKCYFTYEERKMVLEAIKYVDEVLPENNWEQKVTDVQENDIILNQCSGIDNFLIEAYLSSKAAATLTKEAKN